MDATVAAVLRLRLTATITAARTINPTMMTIMAANLFRLDSTPEQGAVYGKLGSFERTRS